MFATDLEPVVIDAQFFTEPELEDIKAKVLAHREMWQPNGRLGSNLYLLPYGLYTAYEGVIQAPPGLDYFKNVEQYSSFMQESFAPYYAKILSKVESLFEVTAKLHPKFNPPGFHIFALDRDGSKQVASGYSIHKDRFNFCRKMARGKIYSIILPIVLPVSGSGLTYLDTRDSSSRYFPYTEGMLGMWGGELYHSIPKVLLDSPEDYRITMQVHVNVLNELAYIFW